MTTLTGMRREEAGWPTTDDARRPRAGALLFSPASQGWLVRAVMQLRNAAVSSSGQGDACKLSYSLN
eukprot:7481983-Pyramimonas_sp.AAC.1